MPKKVPRTVKMNPEGVPGKDTTNLSDCIFGKKKIRVPSHFNSSSNQKTADAVVMSKLTGKVDPSNLSDQSKPTVSLYYKEIALPAGYPPSDDEWREDIKQHMQIALWKGTKRMAEEGMEKIPLTQLPVAVGIFVDKNLLLSGQPTSVTFNANLSLTGDSLLAKIQAGNLKASEKRDGKK